jgi:hypothetical protein
MKPNRIAEMARRAIDRRGGMDALKGDVQEVQRIARGRGSLKQKAKAAAAAVKAPGGATPARRGGGDPERPPPPAPTAGHATEPPPPRA